MDEAFTSGQRLKRAPETSTGLSIYKHCAMNLDCASHSGGDECPPPPDTWPLWRYVTKMKKTTEGGGNVPFTCNFCKKTYKGSYSRVKSHLLRFVGSGIKSCPKVTTSQLTEMSNLENEAMQRRERGHSKMVPLSRPVSCFSRTSSHYESMDAINSSFRREVFEPRKRKVGGNTPLETSSDFQAKEQLDSEIAKMFYSGGLPFSLARNPYFIRAFSYAASNHIANYVPPSYNELRTKLLQKERTNVEDFLENSRSTWKSKGVTIVCNGWTDPLRMPVINFMAVNESGTMFVRAINCEGEYKDKWFISALIKEVIVEVGVANVVQVITDNAPVCKSVGLLVEQSFPHIFWTPCIVHTLNLALKNICAAKNTETIEITYDECRWITEIVGSALMIKNFIINHSMRRAMFNEFSKLKLLAVAEARFASVVVMLKRFKLIKQQLRTMVISEKWTYYRDDDIAKARLVKEKILDDLWWDMIDYILAFTEPIYEMLRACDTNQPCLHLVYEMWDTMISQVKASIYKHEKKSDNDDSCFWSVVHKVLEDRWSKTSAPLHCLAHTLNPRCSTNEWQRQHPNLCPPHTDFEISRMRKICLRRLFPNEEERHEVNVELAKFLGCLEEFNDCISLRDRWEMDPMQWWLVHGSRAPHLQSISMKLCGQVSSSSCCERNWSTYSFMHSRMRNQITPQSAQDLIFVHNNLHLNSRKTPEYIHGNTKMWDVAGDAFESMDDIGILEIANLSLDEPELESVLYTDEVGEESRNDYDVLTHSDDYWPVQVFNLLLLLLVTMLISKVLSSASSCSPLD
ncbi:hypothetical protein BUALT_Bualt02G0074500 [Buddleja alternifolia]|uniref:BED-type domain-containing protein n=1 Tax=Buddleja alternifolia TaxID=168488 RepID=A0AAV6Y2G3_9LAMI|nr:hypothetical protein BUALT_Bualt02G0074500 [Buddleja alternifolia]